MNLKTAVLGTLVLVSLFTINVPNDHAQRRQCDPSRQKCPGRKIQQKTNLVAEHYMQQKTSPFHT